MLLTTIITTKKSEFILTKYVSFKPLLPGNNKLATPVVEIEYADVCAETQGMKVRRRKTKKTLRYSTDM